MSRKARARVTIMVGIRESGLTRLAAAEMLGLSCRQTRRAAARNPGWLAPRMVLWAFWG